MAIYTIFFRFILFSNNDHFLKENCVFIRRISTVNLTGKLHRNIYVTLVHREGKLLGIGRVKGNELQWVASVEQGAGRDVVAALANCILAEELWLSVSADNIKAMKLYESLGFVATQELSKWYKIF